MQKETVAKIEDIKQEMASNDKKINEQNDSLSQILSASFYGLSKMNQQNDNRIIKELVDLLSFFSIRITKANLPFSLLNNIFIPDQSNNLAEIIQSIQRNQCNLNKIGIKSNLVEKLYFEKELRSIEFYSLLKFAIHHHILMIFWMKFRA